MSDDNLQDLKQYINTRAAQSFEDTKQYFDTRLSQTEDGLRHEIQELKLELKDEMSAGFAGVGEAFEQVHEEFDKVHEEIDQIHEDITDLDNRIDKRLTKLEEAHA